MRSIFAILVVLCAISASAQDRHYLFSYFTGNGEDGLHLAYSTDGYVWNALNDGKSLLTPTAGKDKLMRDPSIIEGRDGLFHMVWTVSWAEQGIGYSSSKDLVSWSKQRYLPVMEGHPGTRNCWAPELFYDEVTERYMIVWASTIPGKFSVGDDQKYNHRLYYVTTADFKTFSPTRLFYDHGFSVIDAAIAKEGDDYVMFLKDETDVPHNPEKNIRISTSTTADGPYTRAGEPITGDYWAEGPSPIKINGKWFVYFDKYMEHEYGLVTSPDLKNWDDESHKLSMPEGIRHGTAFEVSQSAIEKLLSATNDK